VRDVSNEIEAEPAAPAIAPELMQYAAGVLDWLGVRALLMRFAPGPISRRALVELVPRSVPEAREALQRAGELIDRRGKGGSIPVGACADPVPILAAAKNFGRALDGDELCAVLSFLRGSNAGLRFMREQESALPALGRLAEDAPDLSALEERLDRSFDEKGRLIDEASPLLAKLRHSIHQLSREIDGAVKTIANRRGLRNILADGHVGQVHRRAGRSVLAVKARSRGQLPGLVHDRSQSGETLFIEPREVIERGNELAERKGEERREESRLFLELTRDVFDREEWIENLTERMAEFELAALCAEWSQFQQVVPAKQPGDKGAGVGLVLRGMCHPLLVESQERGTLEQVIPLDLRLGNEFDLLIITGPNTGGKTLALKSAGLAVLLTRLGLPVPALEGTTIPMFEGIAADIGDEQEILQNLSTFSSHLVRIRDGLARANSNTLVLLDELGSGTDPDEGAALGDAILETLLELGVPTLCSTHLGKLKEFAFRHGRAENASVEFDLKSLAPLYRLLVGTPGESRALYIARRLGLSDELVERAESRVERRSEEVTELLADVRQSREQAEAMRLEAEARLEAVAGDEREFQHRVDSLEDREGRVEAEAQRALEERLEATKPQITAAAALLSQLPNAPREALKGILEDLESALRGATLGEKRDEFLKKLKKGQLIYVPRFKRRCAVTRIWKARGEVSVRMGRTDITLSIDQVTEYESL
jgi:DNA mismatch repair protein MutS2